MYPIILEIGPIRIYSYGLMMALAFIVASLLLQKEFERIKINPVLSHSITLVAIVCGVIGARAYSIIESWTWSPVINGTCWENRDKRINKFNKFYAGSRRHSRSNRVFNLDELE
ncbi:MAG: prolipoprotein diacylglyceryl transferase family protein [Candidatus Poribacteria bacterium]